MTNFIRAIVASAIFASAFPAHAELLMYIPGVDGYYYSEYKPDPTPIIPTVPQPKPTDWNELNSFEAGYDINGCNEVSIEMRTSDATAQIIANGIMGTINPQIYIHAVSTGSDPYPRVYYTLNDAVIVAVKDSGDDTGTVSTALTILPASITVESFTNYPAGETNKSGEATILCTGKLKTK